MNESKIYFLIGEKCFFNRFTDGNFKSKWNGLWVLTRKFLEYYAIKVNDRWLTTTQKAVEECLEKFKYYYEIGNLLIEESLFVPEKEKALFVVLRFENKGERSEKVRVEVETAINIRDWNENWNEREYDISYRNNLYVAKCEKGKLIFYSTLAGEFIGYHFYKTHYPSNEPQRCFVTKNFVVHFDLNPKEFKSLIFVFACDAEIFEVEAMIKNLENLEREKREAYEKVLSENSFSSDFGYLNELFKIAVLNLKKDVVEFNGKRVFVAGYPWFTQVWGRDSCLAISNCVIDEDAAKNTLILLKENCRDGLIPNFVMNDFIDYNSSDATPLFVIAFYNYIVKTGKIFFIGEFREKLLEILKYYKKSKNEHGFIFCKKNSTWMDSLEREGYCLEVQVFWYYALLCLSRLFSLLDEKELVKEIDSMSKVLKKNIIKYFKKGENCYIDVLGKEDVSINQIFLPLFEVIPLKKDFVLELEKNFSTDVGLATLPLNHKEYNPASYHKGATWTHLLALLSLLEFKVGRVNEALENLRRIYNNCNSLSLSSIPEVWNSETGELFVEKSVGREESAFIQLWSAASIIRAIDEGLLGLEYDAIAKVIKISPKLEGNFSRRFRIGEDLVTLSIEYKNKKLNVSCQSKLGIEYKIIALEEI